MPTCKAYGCSNRTGRLEVKKSFFMIPRPVNEDEKLRAARWLHNIGTGHTVANYKFGKDVTLCEDHFDPICFKEDLMTKLTGIKPKTVRKDLVSGAVPSIFKHKVYNVVNMDGTQILQRPTSIKRREEIERDEVCNFAI